MFDLFGFKMKFIFTDGVKQFVIEAMEISISGKKCNYYFC